MANIPALITQGARARGVDPNAALAVSRTEGLGGGIGDNGTSFGPFQLHIGGAMPGGIANPQAWANSPVGIGYALDAIAKAARGLTGQAAVDAIVRKFERPKDPTGEIAKAMSFLGANLPVGGAGSGPGIRRQTGLSPLLAQLMRQTNSIVGLPSLNLATGPQRSLSQVTPADLAPQMPGGANLVHIAPSANRAGVDLKPGIIDFVGRVAHVYGSPLTIGTGTNHNQYVKDSNRESAHWTGGAADIPASGTDLTKLGQDALIAAGMDATEARKQTGGLFNFGGYQIIFNSLIGGNHFNHLHVGLEGAT